jgi:hypothetical protein
MPILFIHGVAVRDDASWKATQRYLREYVAPVIANDPQNVDIHFVKWYPVGGKFAWKGASRPPSLLGMGADAEEGTVTRAVELAGMPQTAAATLPAAAPSAGTGGLIAGGAAPAAGAAAPRQRDLAPDQLSDRAADEVAHDPATPARLAAQPNAAAERAEFERLVAERWRARAAGDLAAHGGVPGWLQELGRRLDETLQRASGLPGWAVSRVLGELRRPLNDFVTLFFGDVFTYLQEQTDGAGGPGPIVRTLLDGLRHARDNQRARGGEPLIVLSHSMGGQVVYDTVTWFLEREPGLEDVRVDFWCATASQVGLFEELKLFMASDPAIGAGQAREKVPFPAKARLGHWWNVWDYNDFISYTGKGIFEGVHDDSFDSGMSLIQAHGGYIQRPSFYRTFAGHLRRAAAGNWRRG